jgi:hypothetical protein
MINFVRPSGLSTACDFVVKKSFAYRNMKREQLRETAGKVRAAADKATDFIDGLLDDSEAPYPVRLNAALKLLDQAALYTDIETRINGNAIKDSGGSFDWDGKSPL